MGKLLGGSVDRERIMSALKYSYPRSCRAYVLHLIFEHAKIIQAYVATLMPFQNRIGGTLPHVEERVSRGQRTTGGVVAFSCRGHRNIRALHHKSLELTRAEEISSRATCVVGVGAAYDVAATARLKGTIRLRISAGDLADELEAEIAPFPWTGDSLIVRRSSHNHGRTFACSATKAARQLDRRLVTALAHPDVVARVELQELGGEAPACGALSLMIVGSDQQPLESRLLQILDAVDLVVTGAQAATFAALRNLERSKVNGYRRSKHHPQLLAQLCAGQRLALVLGPQDLAASTTVVELVRAAVDEGVSVCTHAAEAPAIGCLLASGISWERYCMLTAVPSQPAACRRLFTQLASIPVTLVMPLDPKHQKVLVQAAAAALGDRLACLGYDLGGVAERLIRGPLSKLSALVTGARPAGNACALVIAPLDERDSSELGQLLPLLRELVTHEVPLKTIATALSRATGYSRQQAYRRLLQLRKDAGQPEETDEDRQG